MAKKFYLAKIDNTDLINYTFNFIFFSYKRERLDRRLFISNPIYYYSWGLVFFYRFREIYKFNASDEQHPKIITNGNH